MAKVCLVYSGIKSLINTAVAKYAKNIESKSLMRIDRAILCAKINYFGELALDILTTIALRRLGLIGNKGTVGLVLAGLMEVSSRAMAGAGLEEKKGESAPKKRQPGPRSLPFNSNDINRR